jgi:hypothetical protein
MEIIKKYSTIFSEWKDNVFYRCVRFVFNRALPYQKERDETDKRVKFSYAKLQAWKKEWARQRAAMARYSNRTRKSWNRRRGTSLRKE